MRKGSSSDLRFLLDYLKGTSTGNHAFSHKKYGEIWGGSCKLSQNVPNTISNEMRLAMF